MLPKKQLADFRSKMEELKSRFKKLAAELEQAAREQGWSESGFVGKVESLAELEELYAGLEEFLRLRQGNAAVDINELLDKAGRIVPADGESSVELGRFREKLQSYRKILSPGNKHDTTAAALQRQIQEGRHPLNALLSLMEENLPFDEAAELFEAAAAEFGTSLVLAAVRGRLTFTDTDQTRAEAVTLPAVPAAAEEPAGEKHPRGHLTELLYRLLREAKLTPAFWLSAYYQQQYGTAPVYPWLIKALEAAAVIRSAGGPAAEWLSYLYRKYDFTAVAGKTNGEKLAFNLLYFSALLRPALAAPETGATSLLALRQDLPGELKSLADAVSSGNGTAAESSADWKRELELLSRDAQSWSKQNRKLTLASPLASQLWETMLEEGGMIHRLLRPMMLNDVENLEDTSELVGYLLDRENMKKELSRLYREMPGVPENMEIFHVPGSWQVMNRLKNALKLAERYVKLYQKAAGEAGGSGNPRAEQIYRFLEPARRELQQLSQYYGPEPLMGAALAVAGRALNSVEEYFSQKAEATLTPEKAASLEVEENPQLMLKPPWEPRKKTIERMGNALLELLADSFPTQKKAEGGSLFVIREETAPSEFYATTQNSTIPADLDKLSRNQLLTPQEREFLQNTIKSLQNN